MSKYQNISNISKYIKTKIYQNISKYISIITKIHKCFHIRVIPYVFPTVHLSKERRMKSIINKIYKAKEMYIQTIQKYIQAHIQHIYNVYTKQSGSAGWRARPGPGPGGGSRAQGRASGPRAGPGPPASRRRLFCIYLVYMLYICWYISYILFLYIYINTYIPQTKL